MLIAMMMLHAMQRTRVVSVSKMVDIKNIAWLISGGHRAHEGQAQWIDSLYQDTVLLLRKYNGGMNRQSLSRESEMRSLHRSDL